MITRREIEERVLAILAKHKITGAPVPVKEISVEEGLPVIEQFLSGDVSGALIQSSGVSAIAVNGSHGLNRQRFTIAHELGHYYLAHKGDEDHVDWQFTVIRRDGRSSEATNVQEIEANAFAANLLMPKHMLRSDLEFQVGPSGEADLAKDEIAALARKYQVSETAMTYRLINLGLISPT